ncbi:hypothetical protein JTB14_009311 [Gonioctena quinquepunctata]|nr:hypothetical protein JTB14_009311 [Gonioctena quinquepunctata]
MILGDFNGHNIIWGSQKTTPLGGKIANTINSSNFAILNNGANTHFNLASGSSSAIDLSLCSPSILIDHTWRVAEDSHGSDHFPIIITNNSCTKTPHTPEPKWKLDTANWDLFQELIKMKISSISINNSIDDILSQFNEIVIQSASQAMGETEYIDKDKIVPWWNSDCDRAIKQSEKSLNTFKHNNTTYNLIDLKRKRAIAEQVSNKAKRDSWHKYAQSINRNTPLTKVWRKIKKITGANAHRGIQELEAQGKTITNPSDIANELATNFSKISANNDHDHKFLTYKEREEQNPLQINNISMSWSLVMYGPLPVHELGNNTIYISLL